MLPAMWGLAETALVAGDPESRTKATCVEAVDLAESTDERPLLVPFVVTGVRARRSRPGDPTPRSGG